MYKNEVFVRFIITSDIITPQEISKTLHKIPNTFWNKNAPKNDHPTLIHKYNKWEIFIKSQNIYHTEKLLKQLLTELELLEDKLPLLTNVDKQLSIVIYKKETMPSISYDTKIISFLNKYNISLDVDIYCLEK